jgi:hypothetical protein
MRSIWASRPTPPNPTQIHTALTSFADECRRMLVHLALYLGVLALLAIIGAHLWGNCPIARVWSLPPRPVGAWPPIRTRLSPSASSIYI